MHGRSMGGWRIARACALTATTLAVSCTAHLLGGGHRPSLPAVVGLVVTLLVATFLLLGRRRGPLIVGAALVIGQALVHQTLMLTAMPAAGPMSATHSMASHSMHVTSGGLPAVMAPPAPVASGFPLAMLAWHALATLAIAAGLAFGERAVNHLARWVLSPRSPGVRLPAPVVLASVQAVAYPVALRSPWLQSVSRRGPPRVAANLI